MDQFRDLKGFNWDEWNLRKSWEKHQVTFLECEQVFFNRPLVVGEDKPHSEQEARYYVLGTSDAGRLLFIVFAVRGDQIRVVSARAMNKKERRKYHEETQKGSEIQE